MAVRNGFITKKDKVSIPIKKARKNNFLYTSVILTTSFFDKQNYYLKLCQKPPIIGGFRALLIPPIRDWWNSVV